MEAASEQRPPLTISASPRCYCGVVSIEVKAGQT